MVKPMVTFTDQWGAKHSLSLAAAARVLKAWEDAWPGGLEEVESAVKTATSKSVVAHEQAKVSDKDAPSAFRPVGRVVRPGRNSLGKPWHGAWFPEDGSVDLPENTVLYAASDNNAGRLGEADRFAASQAAIREG